MRAGARNVEVVLRGGTYRLDRPLRFGADDSPAHGTVTWRAYVGEQPVLSGGERIRGVRALPSGKWVARVPAGWTFRQLYVDGVRVPRSSGVIPPGWLTPTARGYLVGRGADWRRNAKQMEFVYDKDWSELRGLVARIEGNEIVMRQPFFSIARQAFGVTQPAYVDNLNAFEVFDSPGEWYLDESTHLLTYLPRAGETPAATEIVAPRLTHLVESAGAHDLAFVGLTFADSSWLGVEQFGGWAAIQAGFAQTTATEHPRLTDPEWKKMPAAVSFTGAQRVRFSGDTFRRLGGAGLALADGSTDNSVVRSTFTDISGTGIELGDVSDYDPADPREVVARNVIEANTISHVALEYAGSVGIWAGYVRQTLIAWNELSDLPYSAISVGWGWDRRDVPGNPAGRNVIAYNLIHDYMLKLQDGGGVYLLGAQPGTVIEGNVILRQRHTGGGLYLDDGSRGETVTGNVVFNTRGAPFVFKGAGSTITGNYWEAPDGGFGWQFFGGGVVNTNTVIARRREAPAAMFSGAGPRSVKALSAGLQCVIGNSPLC